MAYAGYVPAKLPPGKPTEVQQTLWSIKSEASLEVLHKLSYNTACQPGEEKFRKVKLSNNKISATIVEVPGAVEFLKLLGWTEAQEDGETVLLLPKGTNITMAQVRAIQDAQERLKKEAKMVHRSKSAPKLADEALAQQLEADRLERAAREPVTKGSTAQALPAEGARIADAKDVGMSHGCC